SDATRLDLRRFYGLPEEKIAVVPHGVDPEFFELGRDDSRLRNLVLCVSTLHPHKNLDRLVRAFRDVHRKKPEFRLVIAGMHGFETRRIEQTIIDCRIGAQVHLTGWIPRDELLQLYRTAFACVYPSTFEGFGMPVLECLAAGIPSAISQVEPMKSIAGDAAVFFDPFQESEISASLLRIIDDKPLRERLVTAGPRRARQFSWETSAKLTLEQLQGAAARQKPGLT
ncbi:MAG: glycosyltransferase family 4 protein, partial [Bryobacterales bacterium]|nr:glycosyltransferase family 4 protein [Bryobacterales bacterium]